MLPNYGINDNRITDLIGLPYTGLEKLDMYSRERIRATFSEYVKASEAYRPYWLTSLKILVCRSFDLRVF